MKVAAYAEYRLLSLEANDMFGYITISTGIAATNIINNTILRVLALRVKLDLCQFGVSEEQVV